MSKFTKYRQKERIKKQERYERLVKGCEKLNTFNKKVQKLFKDHPDFILDPNDEESLKLWREYTDE